MGLMDAFKGIFGSTQDTQTQQSGTVNQSTQNNAWNNADLQGLFSRLFGGTQSSVQTNPYQTQAADQLANAAQYAQPAFSAANNIAGQGIGDPSRYMPQYTQNVVDATQAQFDNNNARSLAGQQASAAKAGALGGTQRGVNRAIAEGQLAAAQKPVIAGLYNQGYQTSVDTAAKDAALRAQGASTTAGVLGAYTNAGNAAYTAGAGLTNIGFQNAMLPYQQQASFLPAYLQAAGTNSATNSSGTTNSSTVKTDSPFDIGMDLLGGAMSLGMFSDERVKHDIKPVGKTFDGMPIYTYKYNGDESGRTHMGLMAQDVEQEKPHAVGSYHGIKTVDYDKATRASGGAVEGSARPKQFHEKVTDAFKAITEMKRSSGGGVMPRHGYATDGFVDPIANDPGVNYDSNWTPVVEKAPPTSGFQDWLKGRGDARAQSKGQGNDMSSAITSNERAMSSFMSGMTPRANGGYIPQGHRDGNPVWSTEGALDFGTDDGPMSYAGAKDARPDFGFPGLSPDSPVGRPYSAPETDGRWTTKRAEEPAPESGGFFSGLSSFLPSVKREGVITGDKITPDQSIGAIISGMGRGRYRDSVLALSNNRFKELEAEREAGRLLGNYQGQPTMDARRLSQEAGVAAGILPDGRPTLAGIRNPWEVEKLKAEVGEKNPANLGARMMLAKKLMAGQQVTPEDIAAAYGSAAENRPQVGPPSTSPVPPAGVPIRQPTPGNSGPGTITPPATRVAGGPEYRDPSAPVGSERNPGFVRNPADAQPGTWNTSPTKLWPPQYTPAPGETAPPASAAPPQSSAPLQGRNTGPRAHSPETVPQGGDPTANATRPNASPASTVRRPYLTEEDQNLVFLEMVDPKLAGLIKNTPGFKERVTEAEARGKKNVETEEKQSQGRELERQMNELEHAMVQAGPEVLNYATGPYLSDPTWQKRLALIPFANGPGSVLERAQILNTKVQHTIDALSTQYSALTGGKVTSDAARAELKAAVGEAFKARGPSGVFEILHDAKRNIQGLARLPIDEMRKDYYPEQWRKPERTSEKNESRLGAPEQAPPAPEQKTGGLTKDQLLALPDGPVPGTTMIKRGTTMVPASGPIGSITNPHAWAPDAVTGQYFYDKGKLYKRTGWFQSEPVEAP